jgi:nudix-type nucleoside diphosphatase (YffH/AdpP family)
MTETPALPELLVRRVVYRGYLTVATLLLRLRDGAVVSRDVEYHGDAAAVLPYDPVRRCALVARLFRGPVFDATGEWQLEEACAGMIGHEDAYAAASREAREELGISLGQLEFIARIWPSPGISSERQTLFLAPYAATDRTGPGGGLALEHEDITVVERPLDSLAAEARRGGVADGKLLTLIMALQLRRPDLFEPSIPALEYREVIRESRARPRGTLPAPHLAACAPPLEMK